MSDTIGRGVIEVSADATKLRAGIDEAKKSIRELGSTAEDATKRQSASIDKYIKQLGVQAVTLGKNTRETELYQLGLRGASNAQLAAANSALKLTEAHEREQRIRSVINTGLIAAAGAATLAAGAFISMVTSSINAADNLNDLNKKTGISVESLSGLALAAKQSGSDLDGVAASISKLSQNIGKDPEKFKALGVTAKEPLEAFKQLADIFVAIDDPQTRAAFGAAALGKSWQSAAPLLAEGGKSIGEMVDKGTKFSGITKDMAEGADKLNDQLAELKAVSDGMGMKMAGEMVGPLTDITKAIKEAYTESGKLSALWVSMGAVGAFLFTDEFASAKTKISDLSDELVKMEKERARRNAAQARGMVDWVLFGDSDADLSKKIANAKGQIASLQDSLKPKAPEAPKAPTSPVVAAKVAAFIKDPKIGGTTGKDPDADFKAYLKNLQNQISKTNELNAAEKLLADIRSGNLTVGAAQQVQLMTLAKEVDATKDAFAIANERAARRRKDDEDSIQGIRDIEAARAQAAVQNAADVENIRASLLTGPQAENEAYAQRLASLQTFHDKRIENEVSANAIIEAETARHEQAKQDAMLSAAQNVLSIAQSSAGQLYDALKAAGLEQTALGKALFIAQKAIQIASIIVNTEVAAAAAQAGMIAAAAATAAVSGPLGPGIIAAGIAAGAAYATITRAMGYSTAAIVAGTAIASLDKGTDFVPRDMIAQIHKGEAIIPAAQNSGRNGGDMKLTIVNNTSAKIGKVTEQRLPNGERALIIEEAVAATAAHLSDPNSKTSRAMSRNFALQRSR
jgi:hypothetical protein